jgi:hypothetical protein
MPPGPPGGIFFLSGLSGAHVPLRHSLPDIKSWEAAGRASGRKGFKKIRQKNIPLGFEKLLEKLENKMSIKCTEV